MSTTMSQSPPPQTKRDPRAIIIAVAGLLALVVLAIAAFAALPDSPIKRGQIDNRSGSVTAIASAVTTAIAAVVSAYFGVKSANLAREEGAKSNERQLTRIGYLAAAAAVPENGAEAALARAEEVLANRQE